LKTLNKKFCSFISLSNCNIGGIFIFRFTHSSLTGHNEVVTLSLVHVSGARIVPSLHVNVANPQDIAYAVVDIQDT
jgi:hypothetical protein